METFGLLLGFPCAALPGPRNSDPAPAHQKRQAREAFRRNTMESRGNSPRPEFEGFPRMIPRDPWNPSKRCSGAGSTQWISGPLPEDFRRVFQDPPSPMSVAIPEILVYLQGLSNLRNSIRFWSIGWGPCGEGSGEPASRPAQTLAGPDPALTQTLKNHKEY